MANLKRVTAETYNVLKEQIVIVLQELVLLVVRQKAIHIKRFAGLAPHYLLGGDISDLVPIVGEMGRQLMLEALLVRVPFISIAKAGLTILPTKIITTMPLVLAVSVLALLKIEIYLPWLNLAFFVKLSPRLCSCRN